MKPLNEKLENGLIPIVEIAKMIFSYDPELNYLDLDKPEFYEGELLVSFCGDLRGSGITEYLFFENNLFKLRVYDNHFTTDDVEIYTKVVDYDPIKLLKKLVELGVVTSEEIFN